MIKNDTLADWHGYIFGKDIYRHSRIVGRAVFGAEFVSPRAELLARSMPLQKIILARGPVGFLFDVSAGRGSSIRQHRRAIHGKY